MTHTCNAGECSITCETGCGCIGSGSDCECVCDDASRAIKPWSKPLGSNDRINVSMNNLSLVKAAVLLNAAIEEDVLIPASSVDTSATLELKNVTLGEVVRQLGLTVIKVIER
ncbi:MAG: hypothetical protein ACRBHB_16245 [Arenicella sp.]